MLEPIQQWKSEAQGQDKQSFVLANPSPAFVVEPFSESVEASFGTVAGFLTRGPATEERVAFLRKRPGANRFEAMITIGRATNNDVVINYPKISKFHAYVVGSGESQAIVDAKSKQGTTVCGRRLDPQTEQAGLEPGDEVRLADLVLVYHSSESLYEYLTR
jgi:pSer/pThr/pTyr-binding forkhead associated (FHA) protein